MTFKLNQLQLDPDYDSFKDWKSSFGKDYSVEPVYGGVPVSSVTGVSPEKISVSFPLCASSASAGRNLIGQVKELVKNPDVDQVYLSWSNATHLNGFYTLEDAKVDYPEGAHTQGFASFQARLTKIGEENRAQRALQANSKARSCAYGTWVGSQKIHGFPVGVSVFSTSGTHYTRTGSYGNVPVVRNAGSQDLFPYEQVSGSIGLGDVRVYDTMTDGSVGSRSNWVEVYGPEHTLVGDVVLENSLIQVYSRTASAYGASLPGAVTFKRWSGTQFGYLSVGHCYLKEQGGVNHGTTIPKISLNKVSPEESEFTLTFPPVANSLKLRCKVRRGRWDFEALPYISTGSVQGSLEAVFGSMARYGTAQSDAVIAVATAAATQAVAMATKNYLVGFNSATSFYCGLARVGSTGWTSRVEVLDSVTMDLRMATGSDYISFFAVQSPGSVNDQPADLGGQLVADSEGVTQVIER